MKEKIILFVIGVLVGTIIFTGVFYVYTTTSSSNNSTMQIPGGNPPIIPNAQRGESGLPSEMPSDNNSSFKGIIDGTKKAKFS